MNVRQRKSADLIKEAISKSLIPRNQISTISGLTNTYIRDLEQGNIVNVSREKLICFATSVNMTLEETDELLTVFDRAKLVADDIPLFIKTASQKKASSVVNVARDFFGYELLLLAAERIPGPKTVCVNHPTVTLQPEGLRSHYVRTQESLHPIHLELKEAIGLERKRNLTDQLAKYAVTHYIYLESLKAYLLDCTNSATRLWRIKHMEELIKYILKFDNFKYYIIDRQTGFNFLLKFSKNKRQATRLFFYTHDLPRMQGKLDGQVIGFFTGNKVIVGQFKKDADAMKSFIIDDYLAKNDLVSFLEDLIAKAKNAPVLAQ